MDRKFEPAKRETRSWETRENYILEELLWELQDANFLLSQILTAIKTVNNPERIVAGKITLGIAVPQ